MKFVMMGWDGPEGEEKRKALRPGHLEQLKRLDSQGRLVLAGPFSDKSGSLVVIEMDSLEEARAFVQSDPYVKGGVFKQIDLRPFTQVFPVSTS
ncbi:MAG TPA: YciI family protein [Nitrospiria bacterium]